MICCSYEAPYPNRQRTTEVPVTETECTCKRFIDAGGVRIADLACPKHGVDGTDPGDGWWDADDE